MYGYMNQCRILSPLSAGGSNSAILQSRLYVCNTLLLIKSCAMQDHFPPSSRNSSYISIVLSGCEHSCPFYHPCPVCSCPASESMAKLGKLPTLVEKYAVRISTLLTNYPAITSRQLFQCGANKKGTKNDFLSPPPLQTGSWLQSPWGAATSLHMIKFEIVLRFLITIPSLTLSELELAKNLNLVQIWEPGNKMALSWRTWNILQKDVDHIG